MVSLVVICYVEYCAVDNLSHQSPIGSRMRLQLRVSADVKR